MKEVITVLKEEIREGMKKGRSPLKIWAMIAKVDYEVIYTFFGTKERVTELCVGKHKQFLNNLYVHGKRGIFRQGTLC